MGSTLMVLRQELIGDEPLLDATRRSDGAFRLFLKDVVSLKLAPGSVVSESQLQQRYEVQRPSLRDATRRLADLGLVIPLARKGILITPLDLTDVGAIYDARIAVETALVRLAAQRATRRDIEALEQLGQRLSAEHSELRTADLPDSFFERDQAIHLGIAGLARNRYLEEALVRLLPLSARLWYRLFDDVGISEHLVYHHEAVVTAIAARDGEAAAAAVRGHLEAARTALAEAFTTEGGRR